MSHTASLEEANAARLPLGFRDQCSACVLPALLPPPPCPLTPAHPHSLLIPLNKCRKQTLYMPWKCEDERCVCEARRASWRVQQ